MSLQRGVNTLGHHPRALFVGIGQNRGNLTHTNTRREIRSALAGLTDRATQGAQKAAPVLFGTFAAQAGRVINHQQQKTERPMITAGLLPLFFKAETEKGPRGQSRERVELFQLGGWIDCASAASELSSCLCD